MLSTPRSRSSLGLTKDIRAFRQAVAGVTDSLPVEDIHIRINDRFPVHRLTAHGMGIIGNSSRRPKRKKHHRDVAFHCKVENDDHPAFAAGTQGGRGWEHLSRSLRSTKPGVSEALTYHALFMKSAMEAAGIRCKIVKGTASLQWDDAGWVCDADGIRIKWVWKTWETALDQIRHELDDDAEDLRLHRRIDRRRHAPRLVDVLLREEVMVYEPLWTLVTSNKAILPVVKAMFPSSRFLLDAHFELTDKLRRSGYVAKLIVGRWGANIAIVGRNDEIVAATDGSFDDRDTVYQKLFRLPVVDGHNVQVGTFSAGGTYAGACVRVDRPPIIGWSSDLLPLRVVPDAEFIDAIG